MVNYIKRTFHLHQDGFYELIFWIKHMFLRTLEIMSFFLLKNRFLYKKTIYMDLYILTFCGDKLSHAHGDNLILYKLTNEYHISLLHRTTIKYSKCWVQKSNIKRNYFTKLCVLCRVRRKILVMGHSFLFYISITQKSPITLT